MTGLAVLAAIFALMGFLMLSEASPNRDHDVTARLWIYGIIMAMSGAAVLKFLHQYGGEMIEARSFFINTFLLVMLIAGVYGTAAFFVAMHKMFNMNVPAPAEKPQT